MNGDDEHVFTIPQPDAEDLKVFGAPGEVNRMLLIRVDRPTHAIDWSELREIAVAHGILIDPRDVHHPGDFDGGWGPDRWRSTLARDLGLTR
jgi:hypothetical protein